MQLVLSRTEEPLAASYPSTFDGWPIGYRMVPAFPFVEVPTLDVYGPTPDMSQVTAKEANTPTDPLLIWRFAVNLTRRRLIFFSLDHYISDPNVILEPPYLLALLLLPALFWGLRRRIGQQFAVSSSLAILFVMFNPILTPIIGGSVMPWILWRFVWMLPYALIIAMVTGELLDVASGALARVVSAQRQQRVTREGTLRVYAPVALLLILGLVCSPVIARNFQTLRERAAYPYFFPTPERLLGKLRELTTAKGPSIVLADQDLSVPIPAYVANANVVAHRAPTTSEVFPAGRQAEALQRLIDQDAFYRSRYLTSQTIDILNRYHVDYIVTSGGSNLDIQLRLASQWFTWLLDDQSYSLYAVQKLPTATASIMGNTELATRQWATAERDYRSQLAVDPGNLLALAGMAEIAHARGQFNDAIDYYNKALAYSNLAVLHYRLGQLYTELGQKQRGIAEFDRAQKDAPHIARFHLSLGDACLYNGQDDCAATQYTAAVANENLPDEASRLVALADLWRQRGKTDQALTYYEQAVDKEPSEANELMLVSAYQEGKRFDQADALLRLLRMQHPLSVEVLAMAAQVKAAEGQYNDAVGLYQRGIWIDQLTGQETASSRLGLAKVLLDANRLDEAKAQIDRVAVLQPFNATVYSLEGDLYSKLNDSTKATDAYQKAFRLDPTQVQTYLALSNEFRQQGGRQDETLQLLKTAIRANPDEATLELALGDQLQQRGDTKAAVDTYQAALDMFELYTLSNILNPRGTNTSRAYAYTRLANVSEDLGQMEPAMNYYSAAVAAAPDLPWTQMMYGDALRRRNDLDGAEAAYRRAIQNDPAFANAYVSLADLLTARGKVVDAQVMRQQALQLAISQSAPAQVTSGHVGLSKLSPPTDNTAASSFNSDATQPVANAAAGQEQETVDQIIAQLAKRGDQIFSADEGANVLNLLTRLAENTGQMDNIMQLYLRALDQGKQEGWYPVAMAEYYKGLGDLYLAQNQPSAAVDAYRKSTALDDRWPQARLGLARALTEVGQVPEAVSELGSAVKIAPGFVEAQIALGDAYQQEGENTKALQIYKETAQAHPGNPRATLALARAWQDRQAWDNAERSYRQTIAMNPGDADAYVDWPRCSLIRHGIGRRIPCCRRPWRPTGRISMPISRWAS